MKTHALIGALTLAASSVLAADSGQPIRIEAAKSEPSPSPKSTLTVAHYQIDPVALERAQKDPPYEFRGGQSGSGQVVDRAGNVVMKSIGDEGIYKATVSPDKAKVLVDLASSSVNRSVVLEPAGGEVTNLPEKAPVDHALAFSWHWAGADLLFGSSAIAVVDAAGKALGTEEPLLSEIRYYTFDLKSKKLSEVTMPGTATGHLVNAVDVMGDGHVHLMLDAPREGVEPDLGWFKLELPR